MGRREQIRGRLEAARRSRDAWVALMRTTALADLRDLLAVADQAHHYRYVVAAAYGPGDAAYEEAIDLLFDALDRLDNGGDR